MARLQHAHRNTPSVGLLRPSAATRGLTFVELVVASVILSIVIGGAYALLVYGRKGTAKGMLQADCTSRGCLALERVTRELKRSEKVLYPKAGAQSDYLILQERSGTRKVIYLSKGQEHLLVRVLGSQKPRILAKTPMTPVIFSNLLFKNIANEELFVMLSFRKRTGECIEQFNQVFTSFKPRNMP